MTFLPKCAICGGGTTTRYRVETRNGILPVCRRDWGRLFTHTNMKLFSLGGEYRHSGLGRPPVKDDPAIKGWARDNAPE